MFHCIRKWFPAGPDAWGKTAVYFNLVAREKQLPERVRPFIQEEILWIGHQEEANWCREEPDEAIETALELNAEIERKLAVGIFNDENDHSDFEPEDTEVEPPAASNSTPAQPAAPQLSASERVWAQHQEAPATAAGTRTASASSSTSSTGSSPAPSPAIQRNPPRQFVPSANSPVMLTLQKRRGALDSKFDTICKVVFLFHFFYLS